MSCFVLTYSYFQRVCLEGVSKAIVLSTLVCVADISDFQSVPDGEMDQ